MIRLHRLMRAVVIVETRRLVVRTSHTLPVRSQTSVALSGTPCTPCMLQESARSDGMHCGRCVESHVFVWVLLYLVVNVSVHLLHLGACLLGWFCPAWRLYSAFPIALTSFGTMGCFQRARFCVARPFGLLYGKTGTRNEHLCTRRVGHRGVAICYDILDNTSCRHLCTSYRRYAAVWTSFFRSISRKRCLAHRWEHLQQRWQTFTVRTVAALYSVTVCRDVLYIFNLI